MKEIYKKLSEPIPEKYHIPIERPDKTLTGFPAQITIDRLNEIFGPERWTTDAEVVYQSLINGNWAIAIKLTLTINMEGAIFTRVGFGAMYAKLIEDAYGGAYTQALKRAGRQLGIGRELYFNSDEEIISIPTEEKQENNVSAEIKAILDRIEQAKTIDELNGIKQEIKNIEGEKTQKLVFSKFNDKVISLQDVVQKDKTKSR